MLLKSKDKLVIAKEFAPKGKCECFNDHKNIDNEDGCPFCNPALISAWKRSIEMEAKTNGGLKYV